MNKTILESFLSNLGESNIKFHGNKTLIPDPKNLILLKYLYQNIWIDALKLIDDKNEDSITRYYRKKGRRTPPDHEFYLITGSNSAICYLNSWKCNCEVFILSMISNRRRLKGIEGRDMTDADMLDADMEDTDMDRAMNDESTEDRDTTNSPPISNTVICSHLLALYLINQNYKWITKSIKTIELSHEKYCLNVEKCLKMDWK